jgi:formamidopyrimidine-DNA glycosylase
LPELPDLAVYIDALRSRILGEELLRVRLGSPFVLRSVEPPLAAAAGAAVEEVGRVGKRLVLSLAGDLHLVLHLMIAGRLHWKEPGARLPRGSGLAAFDFGRGTLTLTEAGTRRRASLFLVRGRDAGVAFDRGGVEPLEASAEVFARVLRAENHTLKRALTDPRIVSGIGNAYSDEILHRARLSPLRLTSALSDEDVERLRLAARETLSEWTRRLAAQAGGAFPEKVTAFRPEMAVHGRYGLPCPSCGAPVQRIVYADNECNYCPGCQTGGRILADRALSRLLKESWPSSLDELEGPG